MDAKWNHIVDNLSVRVAMIAFGFSAWLVASVALLAAA